MKKPNLTANRDIHNDMITRPEVRVQQTVVLGESRLKKLQSPLLAPYLSSALTKVYNLDPRRRGFYYKQKEFFPLTKLQYSLVYALSELFKEGIFEASPTEVVRASHGSPYGALSKNTRLDKVFRFRPLNKYLSGPRRPGFYRLSLFHIYLAARDLEFRSKMGRINP